MKYNVYQEGEIIGAVYLDDDADPQAVIDALDDEDLLDDEDDDFEISDEPADGKNNFPLAFFVTVSDEPVCELWPDGYEPEEPVDTADDDERDVIGDIIEGEFSEVH